MVAAGCCCGLEDLACFLVGNLVAVEELANCGVVFGYHEIGFKSGGKMHIPYHPAVECSCGSVVKWNFQYGLGVLLDEVDAVFGFVKCGAVLEWVREIESEVCSVSGGGSKASFGEFSAVDRELYLFFGFGEAG